MKSFKILIFLFVIFFSYSCIEETQNELYFVGDDIASGAKVIRNGKSITVQNDEATPFNVMEIVISDFTEADKIQVENTVVKSHISVDENTTRVFLFDFDNKVEASANIFSIEDYEESVNMKVVHSYTREEFSDSEVFPFDPGNFSTETFIGDFNKDFKVDLDDLDEILENLGTSNIKYILGNNSIVDDIDIMIFSKYYYEFQEKKPVKLEIDLPDRIRIGDAKTLMSFIVYESGESEQLEIELENWKIDSEENAKIEAGEIIALKTGEVVVEISKYNLTANKTITLYEDPKLDSVRIEVKENIEKGDSVDINVVGMYDDGEEIEIDVDWDVSDISIASISNNTLVAKQEGVVVVTASADNIYLEKKIEILPSSPQSIEFEISNQVIVGYEIYIESFVVYKDGSKVAEEVVWSLDDDTMGSFNGNKFVGSKTGNVKIIAEKYGIKVEKSIELLPATPISIIIDIEDSIELGGSVDLRAIVIYNNGIQSDIELVEWIIDDETIIRKTGELLEGLKLGTTKITVKLLENEEINSSKNISVSASVPYKVNIISEEIVDPGNSIELRAEVIYSDGSKKEEEVNWSIDNDEVANLAGNILTGLKAGTVTVTAQTIQNSNVRIDMLVTVNGEIPSSIFIEAPSTIMNGFEEDIKAIIEYVDGETREEEVEWSVDNEELAIIEGNKITGKKVGVVTLIATKDETLTASKRIVINNISPLEIRFDVPEYLLVSATVDLSATILYSDGTEKENTVEWTIDNENFGSLTGTVITALSEGDLILSAKKYGLTTSKIVAVRNSVPTGLSVKSEDLVIIGNPLDLIVEVEYEDGSTREEYAKWQISDTLIATVDENKLNGISSGDLVLTGEKYGLSGNKNIYIRNSNPLSINVTSSEVLKTGEELILEAEIEYEDGNTYSEEVQWSLSQTTLAVLNESTLTGVNEGEIEISADKFGLTTIKKVQIMDILPTSIEITSQSTVVQGGSFSLSAKVKYEDGNEAVEVVNWVVKEGTSVEIIEDQLVGVEVGDSTITASKYGIIVEQIITVE